MRKFRLAFEISENETKQVTWVYGIDKNIVIECTLKYKTIEKIVTLIFIWNY